MVLFYAFWFDGSNPRGQVESTHLLTRGQMHTYPDSGEEASREAAKARQRIRALEAVRSIVDSQLEAAPLYVQALRVGAGALLSSLEYCVLDALLTMGGWQLFTEYSSCERVSERLDHVDVEAVRVVVAHLVRSGLVDERPRERDDGHMTWGVSIMKAAETLLTLFHERLRTERAVNKSIDWWAEVKGGASHDDDPPVERDTRRQLDLFVSALRRAQRKCLVVPPLVTVKKANKDQETLLPRVVVVESLKEAAVSAYGMQNKAVHSKVTAHTVVEWANNQPAVEALSADVARVMRAMVTVASSGVAGASSDTGIEKPVVPSSVQQHHVDKLVDQLDLSEDREQQAMGRYLLREHHFRHRRSSEPSEVTPVNNSRKPSRFDMLWPLVTSNEGKSIGARNKLCYYLLCSLACVKRMMPVLGAITSVGVGPNALTTNTIERLGKELHEGLSWFANARDNRDVSGTNATKMIKPFVTLGRFLSESVQSSDLSFLASTLRALDLALTRNFLPILSAVQVKTGGTADVGDGRLSNVVRTQYSVVNEPTIVQIRAELCGHIMDPVKSGSERRKQWLALLASGMGHDGTVHATYYGNRIKDVETVVRQPLVTSQTLGSCKWECVSFVSKPNVVFFLVHSSNDNGRCCRPEDVPCTMELNLPQTCTTSPAKEDLTVLELRCLLARHSAVSAPGDLLLPAPSVFVVRYDGRTTRSHLKVDDSGSDRAESSALTTDKSIDKLRVVCAVYERRNAAAPRLSEQDGAKARTYLDAVLLKHGDSEGHHKLVEACTRLVDTRFNASFDPAVGTSAVGTSAGVSSAGVSSAGVSTATPATTPGATPGATPAATPSATSAVSLGRWDEGAVDDDVFGRPPGLSRPLSSR
jgi:hypothetical protein